MATIMIFPCSGAADVGEITDRAARALSAEGIGKMDCITAIAARHGGKLNGARQADIRLAIDGCPHACASKVLHAAGIGDFKALQLAEIGLAKGSSPANQANIRKTVDAAKTLLG